MFFLQGSGGNAVSNDLYLLVEYCNRYRCRYSLYCPAGSLFSQPVQLQHEHTVTTAQHMDDI